MDHKQTVNNNSLKCYAAYSEIQSIRDSSSSGGLFYALASYVLDNNGVVYGVSMSPDCYYALYKRVDRKADLAYLQGSKYVQAKMGDAYKDVERDLKNDLLVLFTGVGCQVNGLKLYLGTDYPNLLCVDVICHGVPSPMILKKYIRETESRFSSKIIDINFRSKRYGWSGFGVQRVDDKKTELFIPKEEDPYMQLFLKNFSLRPSCYQCQAKKWRLSDVSLGDFWGIETISSEFNDDKGISLIILRSQKGNTLFSNIAPNLQLMPVKYCDAVKYNTAEYQSVEKPEKRSDFFNEIKFSSLEKLAKKYNPLPVKQRLKQVLKNYLQPRKPVGGV